MNKPVKTKAFRVVLIKPSHYDDDGYVIQWLRSTIPSNTLATVYGLIRDMIGRKVLGDGVDITIDAYDETNSRIPIKKIIQQIKAADGGFVGFIGVQSNQFPRTMDMATVLREAGIQVSIGGFHVSGCVAMLPKLPDDIQYAKDIGISLFVGEAEGRLDQLLKDAYAGQMKPVYNYLVDLPDINAAPTPFLPSQMLRRSMGSWTSFDAGRGCPFVCSFCTIINVQGRKSRRRTADDVEHILRENAAQGITRFVITDDNFARNRDWEPIFDRIIKLREEEGMDIRLTLQVDTMCHKIARFIEKAGRAGTNQVFIGLESISPDNLKAAGKKQNNITEYRKLLLAWRKAGVITCAGYIIGFPADTPKRIIRDIKTIKHELPVDLLLISYLTPLPGSADHKQMSENGEWMDPDMNKYDLNHVTSKHPTMTKEELEGAYTAAWETFYSPEHIETVIRRAFASRIGVSKTMFMTLWFGFCFKHEGLHPIEGGYLRRKRRRDRRPGLALENPLIFYPRRVWEELCKNIKLLSLTIKYNRFLTKVKNDPEAANYMDEALTPIEVGDEKTKEKVRSKTNLEEITTLPA